jgi:hypothetical protein
MSLTNDERVEKLKQTRQLLGQAVSGVGIPQIESLLRDADMSLHWALWNLGEIDDLRPELEAAKETHSPSPCNRGLRAAE